MFARRAVSKVASKVSVKRNFSSAQDQLANLMAKREIVSSDFLVLVGASIVGYWMYSRAFNNQVHGTGFLGYASSQDRGYLAACTAQVYQSPFPTFFLPGSEFSSAYKANK